MSVFLFDCIEPVSLLRSRGQLLFYPNQIVNSVQDDILPLDVIFKSKNRFGRARIERSKQLHWRFVARDGGETSLQLRSCLSEELEPPRST